MSYKRTQKQIFLDELRALDRPIRFNEACYVYMDIQRRLGRRSNNPYRSKLASVIEGPRGVALNVSRILTKYAQRLYLDESGTLWHKKYSKKDKPVWIMFTLKDRVNKHCGAWNDGKCDFEVKMSCDRNCARCTYLD